MSENPTKVEEGILKFRPKARLLYILGHELITDETIAMIELVKNSYDADAQEVHVTLTDVSDKEKVLLNIPLWKEFYTKWGVNLPNGNFWVDLAKITNLEAPQAQALSENVRKAYLDDFRYLKVPSKEEKPMEKPRETVTPTAIGLPDSTKIETEDFVVYIKRSMESIKSFETFDFKGWLANLKGKLQKEKKEE